MSEKDMPKTDLHPETTDAETFAFKSEARQLLDLVVHSLYSNKEIFLRELISNSSDAIDKRRFEALTDSSLATDYEIRLEVDEGARTVTIADNGVGMSREEAVLNLGTIARSGTKAFVEALKKGGNGKNGKNGGGDAVSDLIGQFGVGFYASFMVADKVSVLTRRAKEEGATLWESTGEGDFTVSAASRDEVGTSVTLWLKPADEEDGMDDFAKAHVLRSIVKKYSDFVTYPVMIQAEVPVPPAEGETEETPEGEEPKPPKMRLEWQTINSMKAIWTRPQSEVTEEEYKTFYQHISHDWRPPVDTIRLHGEGTFEYDALVFLPESPSYDLYHVDLPYGLQLYVNRVLIMNEARDLLPRYLRFVKGVVESSDLPLNVSREILQNDRRVKQIRGRIVKKVLESLAYMQKEEREKYEGFWKNFGRVVKEGFPEDADNKERLTPLLMYGSTAELKKEEGAEGATGELSTLAEYVGRMKEGQEAIYYLTGDSREVLERSPHLEAFKAKGYEVLFLTDPVDELVAEALAEFEGKPLRSVGKGQVDLGTEEEREKARETRKEKQEENKTLLASLQEVLKDRVKEVRLSTRLTTSAAVLVGEEHDMSPHLERLLKQAGHAMPDQQRILEINMEHAVLTQMRAFFDEDPKHPRLGDYAELLYGQARLAEGSPLEDPVDFAKRVVALMIGESMEDSEAGEPLVRAKASEIVAAGEPVQAEDKGEPAAASDGVGEKDAAPDAETDADTGGNGADDDA